MLGRDGYGNSAARVEIASDLHAAGPARPREIVQYAVRRSLVERAAIAE